MKRTGNGLPREWRGLPQWVRDELAADIDYFSDYSELILMLVEHSASMRPVWNLLNRRRDAFDRDEPSALADALSRLATNESVANEFSDLIEERSISDLPLRTRRRGPLRSLLVMLQAATANVDPGLDRSNDDRRAVASAIETHVDRLLKQLDRLEIGTPFGMYPGVIAVSMSRAASDYSEAKVSDQFDVVMNCITQRLDDAGIAERVKREVIEDLAEFRHEVEVEIENVFLDPRPTLASLVTGVQEWDEICRWGRNDTIRFIAASLRSWFGSHQSVATQVLATIALGSEISESSVRNAINGSGLAGRERKVNTK